MALQKQAIPINFSKGVDTKSDPYQLQIGSFSKMQNSVFDSTGRLTKRNGFAEISTLPNKNQTNITTLNGNLVATGANLYTYSGDTNQWLNQGIVQPVKLTDQTICRTSTSQSSPDTAVASTGLACFTYTDSSGVSYYQVSDSVTGAQVVPRVSLGATSSNSRVFVLGPYFIVTFLRTVTNQHLSYIAIPINNPSVPNTVQDIATGVLSSTTCGYDAAVANGSLYIGYATGSNTFAMTTLTQFLLLASPSIVSGYTANLVSVAMDTSGSTAKAWFTIWDSTSKNGYSICRNQNLLPILAPTQVITNQSLNTLTSVVINGVLNLVYEINNTYGAGTQSATKTDYINTNTITTTGTVGTASTILRSVGLASKAFVNPAGTGYVLAAYGEQAQPTYFLIDLSGNIYARLAYSNGGGYAASQVLSNVSYVNSTYWMAYLYKDFLTNINKGTNQAGVVTTALYSQTGINIAGFNINSTAQYSSEIAGSLQLTGGQTWQYDGVKPVELGFQVWPENIGYATTTTGGSMTAQQYYYQVTYEWTDGQGNLHRSAPSIPLSVNLTSAGTSTNTVTLTIPTLRLTYKTGANPVRVVVYRWSVGQQVYYQVTSVTSPLINSTTADYVTFTDTQADTSITGQNIIYTTGGVVENIAPPASIASALFQARLFLIDAEDPNLLWFSKQVIQSTPVEMSDLLTLYIAPTSGSQGSTGPMTALGAMDDKLIIFKQDAIYYITGAGPDNTGANSSFSDPIFITSAVGCSNPSSIVLMPNGLMFQSDKGIWLLGRDLSTNYIGAPVEAYNTQTVVSALAIPATNQVRFVLNNSVTLMYDYYFNQWGTFTNSFAISSCLYQTHQTYLNSFGQLFQETPGTYLDGSQPVLMAVTTGWINAAGLQGYERFYQLLLLGTYYTPFNLSVGLSYDYNPSATQQTTVIPDNYVPQWGGEAVWGSGQAWGGPGNVFEARLFPQTQKCESFQVSIQEIFDPSYGVNSGRGLTLSGLNMVVGMKKGYRTNKAGQSFG